LTDEGGQVLRLEELEKRAIQAALRQTGGNRTQAAAALGISIRTLRNKLNEYGVKGKDSDPALPE
jgi:DNA-binding NtrC family response regulator